MAISVDQLDRDVAAVRAFAGEDVSGLDHDRLVEFQQAIARVKRSADALMAPAAAEVARRSRPEAGAMSLACQRGHGNPQRMIARSTGGSMGEAGKLIDVGDAITPRSTEGPKRPVLAAAVSAGRLSTDIAAVIARSLDRLESRLDAEHLTDLEARAVRRAERQSLREVTLMMRRFEAWNDPQEQAQRERERYERRAVTVHNDDGMVVVTARLDTASAAPVKAALDAITTHAFRQRRDATKAAPGARLEDERTPQQIRADALVWLCKHALGCETTGQAGVSTTVVVRVGLEELRTGVGLGEVDGADEPVAVDTVRRMAADAEVIPAVMGGKGDVLNWGRRRRLFSPAQRLALVERDGGCAWCHAPPDWCEAHHVRWWERDQGPSDLDNGVLLCTRCHHQIHETGWRIRVTRGVVWFVPPPSVDPERVPVPGGKAALDVNFDAEEQWRLAA